MAFDTEQKAEATYGCGAVASDTDQRAEAADDCGAVNPGTHRVNRKQQDKQEKQQNKR